jgi:hypothetical protein
VKRRTLSLLLPIVSVASLGFAAPATAAPLAPVTNAAAYPVCAGVIPILNIGVCLPWAF